MSDQVKCSGKGCEKTFDKADFGFRYKTTKGEYFYCKECVVGQKVCPGGSHVKEGTSDPSNGSSGGM